MVAGVCFAVAQTEEELGALESRAELERGAMDDGRLTLGEMYDIKPWTGTGRGDRCQERLRYYTPRRRSRSSPASRRGKGASGGSSRPLPASSRARTCVLWTTAW